MHFQKFSFTFRIRLKFNLKKKKKISFQVIDVNDHAPMFEKPWFTFDISEGYYMHMVLGKIVATDEDYGDNANITYSLISNETHPFYITPSNGILKVNGELDRETKALYELKVMANDNSKKEPQLKSIVEIEINIMDINVIILFIIKTVDIL